MSAPRDGAPLRSITAIVRDCEDPKRATLTLSCGHSEVIEDFPLGKPPPCFRRFCNECAP